MARAVATWTAYHESWFWCCCLQSLKLWAQHTYVGFNLTPPSIGESSLVGESRYQISDISPVRRHVGQEVVLVEQGLPARAYCAFNDRYQRDWVPGSQAISHFISTSTYL